MTKQEYNNIYKAKTIIMPTEKPPTYPLRDIHYTANLRTLDCRSILFTNEASLGMKAPVWKTYGSISIKDFQDGDRGKIFFKGVMPNNLYLYIGNGRANLYPVNIFSTISTSSELAKRDILCVEYHVVASLNTIFFLHTPELTTFGLGHL